MDGVEELLYQGGEVDEAGEVVSRVLTCPSPWARSCELGRLYRTRSDMSSCTKFKVAIGNRCQWKTRKNWCYNSAVPSARDPEAIYRVFGRRLRELREKKGLPQQELAELSGLTRSSIANIEKGKQRVLLHQLVQFAEALGTDVATLVPIIGQPSKALKPETQPAKNAYIATLRRLIIQAADDKPQP